MLGIPAIAISQQSGRARWTSGSAAASTSRSPPRFGARWSRCWPPTRCPPGTLLNVNCPAGEPKGIEVARLGKRLYDDELKLVEEDDDGRKRYQIYGFEPSFEDEQGTDLAAVARGRVAMTPIHFDLTDHDGLERCATWDLEAMLEAA